MFELLKALAGILIASSVAVLVWVFRSSLIRIFQGTSNVIIQEGSLRFYKYPYLISLQQKTQKMTNMAYAVITAENIGKLKVKECEMEVLLRNGEFYSSKVLSSLSADSQERPNPKTVSIDGNHGKIGFHPLALNLDTLQAFLPNHSLGMAGNFAGTLVKPDWYEIFGRTICDKKQSELKALGKIKIPDDIVRKAKIPKDMQMIIDQGGFAVYLEGVQGKIRAKFYGHANDDNVKKVGLELFGLFSKMDTSLEDNGKLRSWGDLSL